MVHLHIYQTAAGTRESYGTELCETFWYKKRVRPLVLHILFISILLMSCSGLFTVQILSFKKIITGAIQLRGLLGASNAVIIYILVKGKTIDRHRHIISDAR